MKADFYGAGVWAVESPSEDVAAAVATITASQKSKPVRYPSNLVSRQKGDRRFYFYVVIIIMRSVGSNLSKEVDKAAEHAHAEMGGGKDLAEDRNHVVVIAGIRLVEVSEPLVDRVYRDHRLNQDRSPPKSLMGIGFNLSLLISMHCN